MSADSSWLTHLGVTAAVAVVPFVAIVGTSFAKILIVLKIVQSGLGAPGVPPNSVLTALAVVMSMFIMAPVADEMVGAIEDTSALESVEGKDPLGLAEARRLYETASPPLLNFLERNATNKNVDYFSDLAGDSGPEPGGLRILLPAFSLSELEEAFFIGFLLLLPFFVVDMVVQNVLLSMGISTVSPTFVSLPLKLLLFIAADGWRLLFDGLVVSYGL